MGQRGDTRTRLPGAALRIVAAQMLDYTTGERCTHYIDLDPRGTPLGRYWERVPATERELTGRAPWEKKR